MANGHSKTKKASQRCTGPSTHRHRHGFEADEIKENTGRNRVSRMNFSMVLVAKASMLQLNVNASGQRKVYDDVQKPASNSHTVENALHSLQRYAIGYRDSPISPNSK